MIMNLIKKPYNYIWYASVALMLLVLVAGFVPQREGTEVRRHISTTVVQLGPHDIPKPIVSNTNWSLRAPINTKVRSVDPHATHNTPNTVHWLNFSNNYVTLHTTNGTKNVESGDNFASLIHSLPNHENSTLNVVQPINYGEALSVDGKPLRWVMEKNSSISCAIEQSTLDRMHQNIIANMAPPPRNESTRAKMQRYRTLVSKAAKKYNLSEAMLFAIIQTESDFSPALVSSQSAMGLMQLLPSTAGGEVHTYLHGHSATITHEDLSNPEVNILFGATYMHLLLTRHLGGIKDKNSRIYCALAAYNMGPGRLIRFFGSGPQNAIDNINKLEAHEVYTRLTTVLPIAETRAYVAKVTNRQAQFEEIL